MTERGESRLTPYVSRLVLEWAATAPDDRYRQLEGTLAFCDLSGFTAMSEKLATLGRLGAEELAEILNRIFSALLADAASYGGSLLKYGGDALLLFFDGDGHAARGAAAMHRMRATLRTLGNVRTSNGSVRVRMSVGVHSGRFDFFLVGASHRELIVTGAGATTCCDMETAADAGQILLSPETAAALPRHCVGDRRGAGFLLSRAPRVAVTAPLPAPSADVVDPTPFVPTALRAHVGNVGVDAEHRHIAVGFISFGGLDDLLAARGGTEVAAVLDGFIATCQDAFDHYECTFLYADVYGDGGKVFFVVGAPVAHEDNEERALRACLEIGSNHFDGLHLHTGVNRGYVFAGDVGATFRRTYTVLGDAVNTAARVMASCTEDGQIRSLPEVLQVATSRYEAVEQAPFSAKGKALPITSYAIGRPLGPRTPDTPLPLVGREPELAALREVVGRVDAGEAVAVNVLGDAGVGKSRLVAELCAALADDPTWTVATTYAERYEQATSFFVVRGLLAAVFGADSAAFHRVAAALEASSDVKAIAPTVLQALGEVAGKLLFVVENAHLADAASNELIDAVAAGAVSHPWALVRVGREQSTQDADVVLGPLSVDATAELARAANPTLLPYDAHALAELSGGNPLFLRQLVAANHDGAALGESVETAVSTRIDTLPPDARDLLRTAAVLGGRFELEQLEDLLLGRRPDYATLGDFITLSDGYGIFRQALYRDVAYEGLPFRRRRGLHLAAGRLMQSAKSEDLARLSLHFHYAQAWPESWEYSRQAGTEAYSTAAKAVAATFFERAAEAGRRLRDLPRQELARAHVDLGQALYYAGRVPEARAAYAAGRRFAEAGTVARAELESREAVSYHNAGDAGPALRWYGRALATLALAGNEDSDAAAEVAVTSHIGTGGLMLRRGKLDRAYDSWHAAQEVAARSASQTLVGRVHSLGAVLAMATGDVAKAADETRQALAAYRADGRFQGSIATEASNLGTLEHELGNWTTAAPLLREAHAAQLAAGNASLAATAQANLAELLIDQGRWDEAGVEVAEADRVFRLVGEEDVVFTEMLQRRLLVRTGRPDPGATADQVATLSTLGLDGESAGVDAEAALTRGDPSLAAHVLAADGVEDYRAYVALRVAAGMALADDAVENAHPLDRVLVRVLRGGRLSDDPEAKDLGIVDVPAWVR